MEKNRKSIVLLTLEDSDPTEGVDENTGAVSMQVVTKGTRLLESTCEETHVEQLPLAVRTGKQAIATNDLSRLCVALCGNMEKEYDSDDSLISNIDYMDADQLAAGSKQFEENIEKAKGIKKVSKTIASVLAMSSKPKEERKKEEKKDVDTVVTKKRKVVESQEDESKKAKNEISFVEIDLPTPDAKPIIPKIKKIAPVKTRSSRKKAEMAKPNGNKTIDQWLTSEKMNGSLLRDVSEEADKMKKERMKKEKSETPEGEEATIGIFKSGNSNDLTYLNCGALVKILEIIAEMVNEIEIRKEDDEEDGHKKKLSHVIKEIDHNDFINKIMFHGIPTDFWTDKLSHSEYLLKHIQKMVRSDDVKEIFSDKKYGFKLAPSECIHALRQHYISKKPKKDNGKSVDLLDIETHRLIKSCYFVKKQFHRDYEPNELVKKIALSNI